MATTSPAISVVIPTIRGWPYLKMALDPLRGEGAAVNVEVIVVDASDAPIPSEEDVGFPVRWVKRAGGSVFTMRRDGFRLASGRIIATTEDHCTIRPGWCQGHVRLHEEHPDAVAVGGAVENGTPGRTLFWAAFLRIQGPFMAPLANGPAARLTGAANLSYKRAYIERLPEDADEEGYIDFIDMPTPSDGETLLAHDSVRVAHHQPTPFVLTSQLDFHNGRSVAGRLRDAMRPRDWVRLGVLGVLPIARTVRTWRIVSRKEVDPAIVRRSLPAILWLHYCQAAGELVGYASGPGDSPRQLF